MPVTTFLHVFPALRNLYPLAAGKGSRMTIYVMLGNLKHDAFEKFETLEERDRKAAKVLESLGGRFISLYYMLGRYDFIAIIDLPTKEALVKFLAIIGKYGSIRTETLETIPAEMLYKIAKDV